MTTRTAQTGLLHAAPSHTADDLAAFGDGVLPAAEVPAFIGSLRRVDSVAARALEFQILTLARQGEVIGARWSDVEDICTWRIPAHLRKSGLACRRPLSAAATDILDCLLQDGVFVFSSATDRPLSRLALVRALRAVQDANPGRWIDRSGAPVHSSGFRRSFCEWAVDIAGHDPEFVEVVLCGRDRHSLDRHASLKRQVDIIEEWGAFSAPRLT